MEQVFIAKIYGGVVAGDDNTSALESVLIETARHPNRQNNFMKFLAGELMECIFIPEALALPDFIQLVNSLTITDSYISTKIVIESVDAHPCGSHTVTACAKFVLPVKKPITQAEWGSTRALHPSLHQAINFFWVWPNEKPPSQDVLVDDEDMLVLRKINYANISFEPVEPS